MRFSIFLTLLLLLPYKAISQDLKTYSWKEIQTTGEVTGRHENAFVEFEGKMYLIGGRGILPVNVFDPETNEWSALKPTPFEIHHFQPVVYKNAIYFVGAMTGKYPRETPLENIWKYYPREDRWEKGEIIPVEIRRGGAGAVLYQNKLYLVGGIEFGHTSGTTNRFDCFDPETGKWTTLTKAPTIRDHFNAIIMDEKLYCVGGRNTSFHHPDNFSAFFSATNPYVDVYDFKTSKWITLEQQVPVPSAAGGVAFIGNKLIYVGGESVQDKAHNETRQLDLQTGEWSQLSPLNIGRHGSQLVVYKNCLYFAAGSPKRGGGELTSIEIFSPE